MGRKNKIKQERKNSKELDPQIPRLPLPPKTGEYVPRDKNDLFDNPMTRSALAALSDEDKLRYKEIGEHLYGRINFEEINESNSNLTTSMAEAVGYIEIQLRSGLHPSMMEDNEKSLMVEAYGDDWYKNWGYDKKDLENIFTLKPNIAKE